MSKLEKSGMPEISREVDARKSCILSESKSLLRATHRRRQFNRKARFFAAPILLLVIATTLTFQFFPSPGRERTRLIPLDSEMKENPLIVLEVISDQELLEALSEMGQPSVLANVGNELKLVRQDRER